MNIHLLSANGIQHTVGEVGQGEALVLLHGLTANLHSFGGLIRAGLAEKYRLIVPDLRGRGMSDKPATGYRMLDHAQDILAILDALSIQQALVVGHSFGGLLGWFLANYAPERLKHLFVMDAGLEATTPATLEKIRPSLERLGKPLPSFEAFATAMKATPYFDDGSWDEDIETMYRYDMATHPEGVISRTSKTAIEQAIDSVLTTDWRTLIAQRNVPSTLIHAPSRIGKMGQIPAVLTEEGAQETLALMNAPRYVRVGGHHLTMLFGEHAKGIVSAIG